MSETEKIINLSNEELANLRKDIVLGSLFINDYKNRYGIDPEAVCDFFDGYASYLEEMMDEEDDYYQSRRNLDTRTNLIAWRDCVACGLGL